jgi:hypothetical protein
MAHRARRSGRSWRAEGGAYERSRQTERLRELDD